MKNYVQPGNAVPVAAPAGGVVSGAGVLIGTLFGVAATSAPEANAVEIQTVGVFDLPKTGGDSFTVGAAIYWNATTKACTSTAAGNTRIGAAIAGAAGSAPTVRVRLNGVTG